MEIFLTQSTLSVGRLILGLLLVSCAPPPGDGVSVDRKSLTTATLWESPFIGQIRGLALDDFDCDGDLDLAVGTGGTEANFVFRNEGGVPLRFSLAWSGQSAPTRNVAWADVDNDGSPDLTLATAGEDLIFLNRPCGTIERFPSWTSLESENSTDLAISDFDGDGDLDIFVSSGADVATGELQGARVYEHPGFGAPLSTRLPPTTATWRADRLEQTRGLSLGDADGDGDLDLLLGTMDPSLPNIVYPNDDGLLSDSAIELGQAQATRPVAWVDYDGDGTLEFLAGNEGSGEPSRDTIYARSSPTPRFDTIVWQSPFLEDTVAVAWADADCDGDLDLAVGGAGVRRIFLRGPMGLQPAWQDLNPDITTISLAWGDVNADGAPDLVVGNRSGVTNVSVKILTTDVGAGCMTTPPPDAGPMPPDASLADAVGPPTTDAGSTPPDAPGLGSDAGPGRSAYSCASTSVGRGMPFAWLALLLLAPWRRKRRVSDGER